MNDIAKERIRLIIFYFMIAVFVILIVPYAIRMSSNVDPPTSYNSGDAATSRTLVVINGRVEVQDEKGIE